MEGTIFKSASCRSAAPLTLSRGPSCPPQHVWSPADIWQAWKPWESADWKFHIAVNTIERKQREFPAGHAWLLEGIIMHHTIDFPYSFMMTICLARFCWPWKLALSEWTSILWKWCTGQILGDKAFHRPFASIWIPEAFILVGGWALPPEKYEFVSWDDCEQHTSWKNQTCSKPPTSHWSCWDARANSESHPAASWTTIWVDYNHSLTWNKAIWVDFPY